MKSEYEKQADSFLKKTKTEMSIEFVKNDFYFDGDKEERDIYKVTLKRGGRKYSFSFGNSIADSGFYFTEGRKKTKLDRSLLAKKDSEIARYIRFNVSYDFMNNGKSDIIVRPKEPTPYDILACLTKYDPETFEDFCSEFGYDTDSRSAKKTYKAVVKEWNGIISLFDDSEIELLREIS